MASRRKYLLYLSRRHFAFGSLQAGGIKKTGGNGPGPVKSRFSYQCGKVHFNIGPAGKTPGAVDQFEKRAVGNSRRKNRTTRLCHRTRTKSRTKGIRTSDWPRNRRSWCSPRNSRQWYVGRAQATDWRWQACWTESRCSVVSRSSRRKTTTTRTRRTRGTGG